MSTESADQPAPVSGFGLQREGGVAAYLPMSVSETTSGTEALPVLEGRFAAPAHLVDGDRRTPTGVLSSLVDSVGGLACGLASLPEWIVTTNLTLRRAPDALGGPRGTGPLVLRSEALRKGRSAVVARITTTAADGSEVATAWMTAAILSPADGPPPVVRPVRPLEYTRPDDPVYLAPVPTFFGLVDDERAGQATLAVVDRTRNPWGILHGGAIAIGADAAARSAVSGRPSTADSSDVVVTDIVVHYLSPGRVGPVRATAEIIGRRGADHLVRLVVRDLGADDRPVARAVATVRTER